MGASRVAFELRSISPDATPEEVAAITAAIAASLAAARAERVAAPPRRRPGRRWVQAARISGRRSRLLPGRLAALRPPRAPQPGVSSYP